MMLGEQLPLGHRTLDQYLPARLTPHLLGRLGLLDVRRGAGQRGILQHTRPHLPQTLVQRCLNLP